MVTRLGKPKALDLFFWKSERDRLMKLVSPMILDASQAAVTQAVKDLEALGVIGVDLVQVNNEIYKWANHYSYELVTGITETSSTFLQEVVSEWVGEPLTTVDELAERLTPMFGEVRAGMIAQTEVTRAFAEGNKRTWGGTGIITEMRFMTGEDELVCPECSPLDGKIFPLDDAENTPPIHVNCRCYLMPIVPEPGTEQPAEPEEILPEGMTGEQARSQLGDIQKAYRDDYARIDQDIRRADEAAKELQDANARLFREYPDPDNRPADIDAMISANFDQIDSLRQNATSLQDELNEINQTVADRWQREVLYGPDQAQFDLDYSSRLHDKDLIEQAAYDFSRMVDPSMMPDGSGLLFSNVPAGMPQRSVYLGEGSNTIELAAGTKERSVIHEMGHWWEDTNPEVHKRALEFLNDRTAGEDAQPLRDLSQAYRGYDRSEVAKPDEFLDPYMGKIYIEEGRQPYTEIVSMGIEYITYRPVDLLQDPDYFDFIWGLLKGR